MGDLLCAMLFATRCARIAGVSFTILDSSPLTQVTTNERALMRRLFKGLKLIGDC